MSMTRRDLLRSGWKLGGGLLAAAAGYTAYEALLPLTSGAAGRVIDVGNASDFQEDTATYFSEGRFYLANAQSHYFALSQKCPHLGCRVPFCKSSGRFECPCHGSVFDLGGERISGPTPRGMDRFDLAVAKGKLIVNTGVISDGPDPGAKQFLTPPKGPSCAGKA